MAAERTRGLGPAPAVAGWRRALLMLGLLLLVDLVAAPRFGRIDLVDGRLVGIPLDILRQSVPVALLALGMTAVVATGGIDLSVGSLMAISAAAAAWLAGRTGLSAPVVIASSLAAGAVLGVWNGALVALLGLQPIIATLLLAVAGRGLAQLATGGQVLPIEDGALNALAGGSWLGLPAGLYLALGVLLVLALLLARTSLGLYAAAIGDNARAARLCGLPVKGVLLLVYASSGLCAAAAGLYAAADIRGADASHCGLYLELDAILAVVLGGTPLSGGRPQLLGSALGALLLQTLGTSLLQWGVSYELGLVVKAAAMVAVCALPSSGLVARLRERARRGRRASRERSG